jgi:hypothetical protein
MKIGGMNDRILHMKMENSLYNPKCRTMFVNKLALLLSIIIASGCTLSHKTSYDVRLDSSPGEAKVQVIDRLGREIFNGTTPTQVALKSGSGYFKKAIYIIRYTKTGYLPKEVVISSDINGWYFGNIIFGGLIGFLIVDPATGAMYKLDRKELNETLATDNRTGNASERTLRIIEVNEVPESLKEHLVLLK